MAVIKKRHYCAIAVFLTAILFTGAFYFYQKGSTYLTVLPVKFTKSNLPCVNVVIDKTPCPLIVDLGSILEVSIRSDFLEKLEKTPYGIKKWTNVQGKTFEHSVYTVPKIEIGSLTFKNLLVVDVPSKVHQENSIWKAKRKKENTPEFVGYLGRPFLKKVNLLFDMEQSKLIVTNNLKKLKKSGYNIQSFAKIPFSLNEIGIIIDAQTDLGTMRLLLDTGCTLTFLQDFLYPQNTDKKFDSRGFPLHTSDKFTFKGIDFGPKELYFLKMAKEFHGIDGFLGMDFIKEHVMYIDFSKKVLYIKPPENTLESALPKRGI